MVDVISSDFGVGVMGLGAGDIGSDDCRGFGGFFVMFSELRRSRAKFLFNAKGSHALVTIQRLLNAMLQVPFYLQAYEWQ